MNIFGHISTNMDALFQRNKKALSKATTLDSDTSVFEGELPRKYLFFHQLNIGPFVGIPT